MSGSAWLLLFLGVQAIAAGFIGRSVADVLEQLRGQGLTFIYNNEIVPDDLRIAAEPGADSGVALAREILKPHGLALTEVAPQTFAVVRMPPPAAADNGTVARTVARDPLEEVVVQTSRYALATEIAGSHAFLDQVQVTNLPRLGDETLQAVQRLPGAAVNGFSSIGPIRGGVPNETAILFDGLRLYEPFHLKNYLSPVSLLDSRLIDGIDVYFGGFPAPYGDRMSAIVDARSVRPAPARYYELGLTLFHASALAAASLAEDRGRLLVSARRSNLGELSQLAENDFGKPDYSDGFARLDWRFSDTTSGALNALLSHDRITAVRSEGTERAQDESSNGYLWATLDHAWSESLSSRAILSWTHVADERRGEVNDPGRRIGSVRDDRSFDVAGLRIENEWRTADLMHRFGAEVRRLQAEYEYDADVSFDAGYPFAGSPPIDTLRRVELHPDGYEASGYWDTRWQPNALWALQAGLRVDTQIYDGSGDSAQWSPRLSLLYKAGADTRLRASWGRFYQSQGINELQVEDGIDRFYPAQHANHTILSIEHSFSCTLDARLELYRKDYRRVNPRFENLFDPLVLLPELAFDRVRIAPSSARADGVELWLNWQPSGHWSGWFSYTWSQVQDRIDGADVYRSWDQRHAVSAGIAWTYGPWAVTLADTYHTGWPTTELTLGPDATPVVGPRNAVRYADFNSLDVRVTRTFALPRGELDVFLEATNLYSHRNPCCTEYQLATGTDGNPVLESNVDSWLPLVPSFGVLWRYGK
ncbi:MAG TPA: TonB-dependent receptor [Povalibacter sp.]|uniref:TonB-dependent receptor plug domain-containing protein n=1 Tax=Povalibacter sp. TaxID=1962978 RepID=UPI002CE5ECD7|nr:TonB-dependent receptor [Povalibacter sp.]HMN44874.1 TonB-dependent receptor [Povalibacter sp.]